MDCRLKSLFFGLLGFSATLSTCVSAEPLAISDVPLTSVGKTEPNLMILLDSSENMAVSTLPDGRTRLQAVQQAAVGVVESINNMRVGVARLNRSQVTEVTDDGGADDDDGAFILKGPTSLSQSGARQDTIAKIENVDGSGAAPLGEALLSLGRYFVQGRESQLLTLHPGETSESTATASDVLGPQPVYGTGVSEPTSANPVIQEYCQKNFVVVLTEGVPSKDIDISANDSISDYDGDCVNADPACLTFDRKPGQAYDPDGGSDYLDDVAAALYDINLRPDLDKPDDSDHKNNITSFFIGFANDGLDDNKLLKDAGTNGFGGFKLVADSAQLTTALNEAMDSISSTIGSQSSVSFNSTSLEAGSVIYSARFDTSDFTGHLFARSLNPETGRINSTLWDAAEQLVGETSGSRQIITILDGEGVPFTANSSGVEGTLDNITPHREDLQVNTNDGTVDDAAGLWDDRLDYIRGNTQKDKLDDFRPRGTISSGTFAGKTNLLGDIVHSTPVYVAVPEMDWPSTTYEQFTLDQEDRTPMVYVGANDGMLHAFEAASGEEVFAYVPALVLNTQREKGLHYLTSSLYSHKYYVDLTPTVSDVFIDRGNGNPAQWTTILVGGLRGGGKGYFALNITDPSLLNESNADAVVLWEFDGGDDTDRANLGFGFSEAKIARLNNGKWAAIFGNGYNSENGVAGLFIVYIEDGIDGSWDAGDWEFISTATGSDETPNGLSTPRLVDLNDDGNIDRAYAGDLMGNMWAFDLSDPEERNWDLVGDHALFKAPGEAIMAAPLVALNTAVIEGQSPNVLVMFGTGQYLNQADLQDDEAGAFYAVWDNGHTASSATLTASDLAERTLTEDSNGRQIQAGDDIDWTTQFGWMVRLKDGSVKFAGERVVTSASLRNQTVFFSTIIPNPEPCESSGKGYLMNFDFRTGKADPDSGVADFNNDGAIGQDDVGYVGKLFQPCSGDHCKAGDNGDDVADPGMPGQSGFIGDVRCTPGSNGGVVCDDIDVGDIEREGRLTWEELIPG